MSPIALGLRGLGVGKKTDAWDGWTPESPTPEGEYLSEHWYKSDEGLWQDAGITPVTTDGDVVGRWEDLSANADHTNQGTTAKKPTWQSGAGDLLNGHPVVRFDGIDDYVAGAYSTGGALSQPFTTFLVIQLATARVDAGTSVAIDSDDTSNRHLARQVVAEPDIWNIHSGVSLGDGTSDDDWHIWTCLYNGASSQLWHGGISKVSGDAGSHNPDGLTIGALLTGLSPWEGDMVEILVYDVNLSDADKNKIGRYLAIRYGLSYTDI